MTTPVPETLDRETNKLYVTDAELIRRLGVPEKDGRRLLRELATKHLGFPKPQAMASGRRYWPAVKAYFDKINRVNPQDQ